jgi:uncharacterized protein YbaR (Trm112 family)
MLNKILKDKLVCTWCLGPLDESAARLKCTRCGAEYAIVDDIPNMVLDDAKLFCPSCRRELKKGEGMGMCESCGKKFSLRERIKM